MTMLILRGHQVILASVTASVLLVMMCLIIFLSAYHLKLIFKNLTTYESIKGLDTIINPYSGPNPHKFLNNLRSKYLIGNVPKSLVKHVSRVQVAPIIVEEVEITKQTVA